VKDAIDIMGVLQDKGMTGVRFTAATPAIANFKPIIVIAYENLTKDDRYVMLTSKWTEDSRGKRVPIYSSIRLLSFDGKTKEPVTIKVEDGLQELTSMHPGKF
jgi:hypothetical protein